ncbi:comE operon protein 3 [Acidimicrobiaceae bacterium]|nr:comE operon protein 3 [Acidimicrobiaceae bacterium]
MCHSRGRENFRHSSGYRCRDLHGASDDGHRQEQIIKFAIVGLFIFIGFANSSRAISQLHQVELGEFSGSARVITDPQRVGAATQIILEISGDRFVVYAYGPPAWRLSNTNVGETVFVSGWRHELAPAQAKRLVSKHVKGNFEIKSIAEQRLIASPIYRSAQRVRKLIDSGAKSFPFDERSLFTGLVIGDDSKQPKQMISAFRKSGLAHLVAVSGQNVAFVLTGLSPLLRRLSRTVRLLVVFIVLIWFVVITRVEPSVIRAAVMAGVATLSISLGRPTRTLRILALTVIVTIFLDPLLAWSVGYFMSVGATTGLCLLSAPLSRVVPGPRWLASLIAATISAQVGVAPAVIFVFGMPAAIGILANILAVPVASLVMLVGLPLSLFAGAIGETIFSWLGTIIMWPVLIGVRWVWWVAAVGERLSATGLANFGMWLVVLALILLLLHGDARVEG